MQDGQYLLQLTLEITNYFVNKQDHVMKEKQSNILHHHSLLFEDISRTEETSWKNVRNKYTYVKSNTTHYNYVFNNIYIQLSHR